VFASEQGGARHLGVMMHRRQVEDYFHIRARQKLIQRCASDGALSCTSRRRDGSRTCEVRAARAECWQ
jgi:hypothetical protein